MKTAFSFAIVILVLLAVGLIILGNTTAGMLAAFLVAGACLVVFQIEG